MHESIAAMTKSALEVTKTIIDELSLPNSYKKIKPTMSVNEEKYLIKGVDSQQLDDSDIGFGEDFYVYNGFIIKLAYS